jgi:hypothetical protein
VQPKLNTAQASSEGADYVVRQERALAIALVALALGVAANSILGPVGLGLMRYRTSATTLNQLLGSDAAALFVVVPITVAAAVLAFRRHPVAPLVAVGIGVYALYTYAQVIIGQEYLRLPGNVNRSFHFFLPFSSSRRWSWFWPSTSPPPTPPAAPKLEWIAAVVLLLVAAFLVFGQHLRPMIIAWRDPASLTEYASSPTPFWMVKLMDLGIIVPAAVLTAMDCLTC